MDLLIKEILNNENISFSKLTKSTSGFTNLVYFVDDEFVIKITNKENTKKNLEKEISIYNNITLDNIPKYISSGDYQNYKYLIISKISGKSLYSVWHTLGSDEKENCIKQIAKILKNFNNQNTKFISDEYKILDWTGYLINMLNEKVSALEKMNYNVSPLKKYIKEQLPIILSDNQFGLVYNDAHFDNFIYDNGSISLIDFDRVKVCPIDYEMLIFKTMCDNPRKFANEEDEDKIKNEDYREIYNLFKHNYPEMFINKYTDQRISLYQFNYLIGQAINSNDNEWIKNILKNFIISK